MMTLVVLGTPRLGLRVMVAGGVGVGVGGTGVAVGGTGVCSESGPPCPAPTGRTGSSATAVNINVTRMGVRAIQTHRWPNMRVNILNGLANIS